MKTTAEELLNIPEFDSGEEIISKKQLEYFYKAFDDLVDDAFIPLPSEWAADNRYLPSSVTENYGFWDFTKIKHIADILDCVHPDNIATHIAVIKSVQSGLTVSFGENAMGFFTKYRLGSTAFFTSTKDVGKTRSSSALDVMIDNSGLDDLIEAASNRTGKKSADTTFAKEFAGGMRWQISSYGSIADMKSNSFNLLICDEWDEAARELKNQGDIGGIIEGRTMAVRMFKLLFISTPSSLDTSRIQQNFIQGDQNRYFIPCPHCGGMQHLEMKFKKDSYGLTFRMKINEDTKAKELDHKSVRYICKHCKKPFREFHKNAAIEKGEWRPTWQDSPYVPKSPKHKSFHVPGILSPFLRWARICQQYINTNFGEDLLKFKDFTINYLGESWARIVTSGSWKDLQDRADEYVLGDVPKGGLVLFGGVDVQKDRLELAVLAVGAHMEKWVVDYQVFYGDPSNLEDKCYEELDYYAYEHTYKIEGADTEISLIAIDTGYDPKEKREKDWDSKGHTIYSFVAPRIDKFIAVKGTGLIKSADLLKERKASHSFLDKRYDVQTPIIKHMIMMIIEETGGPNAIHFPKWRMYEGVKVPMSDEFYKQMMSERFQELEAGILGWKKQRDRNEVFDTVIYAIAAMYHRHMQIWTDVVWEEYAQDLRDIANEEQKK